MSFIPVDQLRSSSSDSSKASAISFSRRLPPWFKVQAKTGPDYLDVKQTMDQFKLHTICEEARCPNRWECWNARTATFLITTVPSRQADRRQSIMQNHGASQKRSRCWASDMP